MLSDKDVLLDIKRGIMVLGRDINNPVLVLGGELAGLWVARILGRQGIDVYIVTAVQRDDALSSKYCKKKRFIAGPWSCQILRDILKEAARTTSKRLVVYPSSDDLALNLSIIKDDVPDDFCFVIGKRDAVETLVNKRKFYQVLKKHKIPYPTTFFPKDLADANRLASEISYPIFIKPSFPHLFNRVFGYETKGFVANSRDELLRYYHLAYSKKVDVLFQKVISGPPSSFYQIEGFYNRESQPSVLFARQAMRIWPLNFGNTTLCHSIPLSHLAEESKEITKFLMNIQYNGIMSADFKRDTADGKLLLLEINTRLWLHFWLPTKCGADIITASYLDALNENVEGYNKYATGVKSICFYPDLKSSAKMIRRKEIGFSEYTSSLFGRKVFAYYDRTDMLPFFRFYYRVVMSHLKGGYLL
jgi:D-aspartate ligase